MLIFQYIFSSEKLLVALHVFDLGPDLDETLVRVLAVLGPTEPEWNYQLTGAAGHFFQK